MFDRLFNPLYADSDRVHFGTLDVYVNYLTNYVQQSLSRYGTALGFNSMGIGTLSQILGDSDLDILMHDFPNPSDRYITGVIPTAHRVEPIFDPAYKGPIKPNSFVQVRGGVNCVEYVFPVTSKFTPALALSEDWDQWQSYRPLTLVSTDSKELTLFSYMDRIIFTKDIPSYVMFTLDTQGLILMRIAYLKTTGSADTLTVAEWLHRYVIAPCLFNDAATQWLIQQYLTLVETPKIADDGPIDRWTGASNAELGQLHSTAMNALGRIIEQNNTDAVRIPKVLASMILNQHGSLPEYRKYLQENVIFPQQIQYRWGEFLRDYLPNKLALRLAIRDPKSLLSRTLGTQLPREIRMFLQTVPWNQVKHPRAREQIESLIVEFYNDAKRLEGLVRYHT